MSTRGGFTGKKLVMTFYDFFFFFFNFHGPSWLGQGVFGIP